LPLEKIKNVSANLSKGFLRKNPTKLPYFEKIKIKIAIF